MSPGSGCTTGGGAGGLTVMPGVATEWVAAMLAGDSRL
jgi:hypothetical protein